MNDLEPEDEMKVLFVVIIAVIIIALLTGPRLRAMQPQSWNPWSNAVGREDAERRARDDAFRPAATVTSFNVTVTPLRHDPVDGDIDFFRFNLPDGTSVLLSADHRLPINQFLRTHRNVSLQGQ